MDRNDPQEAATVNRHAAEDDACEVCGEPGVRLCAGCERWLCNACLPWPLPLCEKCAEADDDGEDE